MSNDSKTPTRRRTIVVTGANSGIGLATARRLAGPGADLVLICRLGAQAEALQAEMTCASPESVVRVLSADLSSQSEVRDLAKRISAEFSVVDILIHGAGAVYSDRLLSKDGIEMQFAVNHLAGFMLTLLLLPCLRAAEPGRVIYVSSGAHARTKMDLENVDGSKSYLGSRAYAQSKLASLLCANELARRVQAESVIVSSVNPGPTKTKIGYKHTKPLHAWLHWLQMRVARAPECAAEAIAYLANTDDLCAISKGYFQGGKRIRSSAESRDPKLAKRVWELSERLTGVSLDA